MADQNTHTYSVPGISCDHCKRAIEESVATAPGVEDVQVDVQERVVTVLGGDDEAIVDAIERAGYSVATPT